MDSKPQDNLPSDLAVAQEGESPAPLQRRIDTFWSPGEENLNAETGRAIGHDFARLSIPLPERAERAIVEGYSSARHNARNLRNINNQREAADPGARKLVRLRYSAWKRNRIVDKSVTADFLNMIQVAHCPVTRLELTHGTMTDSDATIDRVFNDGAYAMGNLVVLSQKANLAKANRLPREICEIARSGESLEGLTNQEWCRMACLCEMSSPEAESEGLWPLLVVPPPGIMITQPMYLIMEFISLMAWRMMPQRHYPVARSALSGKKEKRSFDAFLSAFAGRGAIVLGTRDSRDLISRKMGDVWTERPMWDLFLKFMKHMSVEKIAELCKIAEKAFYGSSGLITSKASVLESWHLETRGYVPPSLNFESPVHYVDETASEDRNESDAAVGQAA